MNQCRGQVVKGPVLPPQVPINDHNSYTASILHKNPMDKVWAFSDRLQPQDRAGRVHHGANVGLCRKQVVKGPVLPPQVPKNNKNVYTASILHKDLMDKVWAFSDPLQPQDRAGRV